MGCRWNQFLKCFVLNVELLTVKLLLKRARWPYELDFLQKEVTRKKAASSKDGWNAESCADSADSYYQ
ncbi:hypothetical protein M514_11963 [Trichuris suis]|uniref:Uncharacterized protein n=1 Tax=Trichuris suis TaxID=68888 RepID=A0A085LQA8_9BILA|nr:hypothetical protein M513_11963 [Trichuris suis]KFD67432.1 hypothetical protein M514_11963 [Trichuris suis]